MAGNREAIAASLDLLVELSHSTSVSVPLADFGDWVDVLGFEGFHVCRREPGEPEGDRLTVFATGFYRKVYVAVDTRADDVVGHVVPPGDGDNRFLDLPLSEVANLRAGGR
jgi:hypothetical protein